MHREGRSGRAHPSQSAGAQGPQALLCIWAFCCRTRPLRSCSASPGGTGRPASRGMSGLQAPVSVRAGEQPKQGQPWAVVTLVRPVAAHASQWLHRAGLWDPFQSAPALASLRAWVLFLRAPRLRPTVGRRKTQEKPGFFQGVKAGGRCPVPLGTDAQVWAQRAGRRRGAPSAAAGLGRAPGSHRRALLPSEAVLQDASPSSSTTSTYAPSSSSNLSYGGGSSQQHVQQATRLHARRGAAHMAATRPSSTCPRAAARCRRTCHQAAGPVRRAGTGGARLGRGPGAPGGGELSWGGGAWHTWGRRAHLGAGPGAPGAELSWGAGPGTPGGRSSAGSGAWHTWGRGAPGRGFGPPSPPPPFPAPTRRSRRAPPRPPSQTPAQDTSPALLEEA